MAGKTRDPALFNLAIDSKLRGCNLAALRVLDVTHGGYVLARKTRQRLLAWMRRPATVCNLTRCFAELRARVSATDSRARS
jgi:hypothetical protein